MWGIDAWPNNLRMSTLHRNSPRRRLQEKWEGAATRWLSWQESRIHPENLACPQWINSPLISDLGWFPKIASSWDDKSLQRFSLSSSRVFYQTFPRSWTNDLLSATDHTFLCPVFSSSQLIWVLLWCFFFTGPPPKKFKCRKPRWRTLWFVSNIELWIVFTENIHKSTVEKLQ